MKRKERLRIKREEAAARQEAYNKLTDKQKLAKLNAGGHAAKKERARIKRRTKDGTHGR